MIPESARLLDLLGGHCPLQLRERLLSTSIALSRSQAKPEVGLNQRSCGQLEVGGGRLDADFRSQQSNRSDPRLKIGGRLFSRGQDPGEFHHLEPDPSPDRQRQPHQERHRHE